MTAERNIVVPSLVLAVLLAGGWAALMLWAGFQDNNQGEFFDPQSGTIDWSYSALLFFSWFIAIFVPIAGIGALLEWRRHKSAGKVRP
jgi:hypothetical protein